MSYRLAAAAALLAVARPLAAQSTDEVCKAIAQLKVGQWAQYNLSQTAEPDAPHAMRMAVVGTEDQGGKTLYWLEVSMDSPTAGKMIIQSLVPGFPYEPADVKAMVMKRGDQPAMKMPEQMLEMMRQRLPSNPSMNAADRCRNGKVVGWESVTVPAGTFHVLHVQPTPEQAKEGSADVWVSEDVPFGLVKVASKEGGMELTASGHDAKSSITEKPQELPGMPGHQDD